MGKIYSKDQQNTPLRISATLQSPAPVNELPRVLFTEVYTSELNLNDLDPQVPRTCCTQHEI